MYNLALLLCASVLFFFFYIQLFFANRSAPHVTFEKFLRRKTLGFFRTTSGQSDSPDIIYFIFIFFFWFYTSSEKHIQARKIPVSIDHARATLLRFATLPRGLGNPLWATLDGLLTDAPSHCLRLDLGSTWAHNTHKSRNFNSSDFSHLITGTQSRI